MRLQRTMLLSGVLLLAGAAARAQEPQPQGTPTGIRTETKLVLVDVVVMGKKNAYVEDLELKNFKVWEDNKEQQLKTFSFGADPNAPGGQQRYIVLFFDNSTMGMGEQVQARQAAARFIESNAGPDRLMAVVNFTGALQIAQNFTGDIGRLKQVVGGIRTSAVAPGPERASMGVPRLGGGAGAYGARSMLLALRSMAQNLSEVPGRKSLILFTSGFRLGNEARSEANAAIDSCNKANVAIYPIDVRGLSAGLPGMMDDSSTPGRGRGRAALEFPQAFPGAAWRSSGIALAASPVLRIASFFLSATEWEQTGGRSGGTTGGSTGGNTGGTPGGGGSTRTTPGSTTPGNTGTPGSTRGATPGNTGAGTRNTTTNNNNNSGGTNNLNNPNNRNNPYNNPSRLNIPTFPPSATDNQQI